MKIGQRVELAPHLDDWMKGDRFGAVIGFNNTRRVSTVRVKLGRSGRTRRFLPEDLTVVIF